MAAEPATPAALMQPYQIVFKVTAQLIVANMLATHRRRSTA